MNDIFMGVLLVVAILLIGSALKNALSSGNNESNIEEVSLPYTKNTYLLSKAERSFFGAINLALDPTYTVFTKVRLADLISIKGLSRPQWQRYFNKISSKHIDFIVCDAQNSEILFAIELDDSTHSKKKTIKRDDFVNEVFKSAKIPLLRIPAQYSYNIEELRSYISGVIPKKETFTIDER